MCVGFRECVAAPSQVAYQMFFLSVCTNLNKLNNALLLSFFQTIECYLRAVLNAKGANLYQLSHYTTGVILNDTKDRVIRQGLKKVSATTYYSAFLYVHVFYSTQMYSSLTFLIYRSTSRDMMGSYLLSIPHTCTGGLW